MPSCRCLVVATTLLLSGCLSIVSAQSPPAAAVSAVTDPDPASAQAHALLNRAVKINGPSVEGAAPWHLKADFQWQMPGQPINSGTIEEWWKAPDLWRRTYTIKKTVWTEWSVDRAHSFASPDPFPQRGIAELRIATPLITPLFQAKNFLPEYPMQMQPVGSGAEMSCVSIVDPTRYVDKIDPDFLFPKYCLDKHGVLHGVMTSNTLVTFGDFTVFNERAVAKTVDVIVDGAKTSEAKITLLEPLASADEPLLQPDKGATPEPFQPMASDPRPVLIHAERPMVPANMVIEGSGGNIRIAVIIGKDGKVRPRGPTRLAFLMGNDSKVSPSGGPILGVRPAGPGISAAAYDAAQDFRYQPYLIDGQPVEVAWTITFPFGKNGYEAPALDDSNAPAGYDPKRDPAADLKNAEAEAQQSHRHIILEVGGAWCIWCGYMDRFFADHPDIAALIQSNYVLVKVNWSQENHNNEFLSQYATVNSFPFLIVLDEHGKLLQAQRTSVLEKGTSYDPDKMKDFLNRWKPSQTRPGTEIP